MGIGSKKKGAIGASMKMLCAGKRVVWVSEQAVSAQGVTKHQVVWASTR